MGNKKECPICKSYSSTVFYGLQDNGKCPICGTSAEYIENHEIILEEAKLLKSKAIQEDVVEENAQLKISLEKESEKNKQLEEFCMDIQYELEALMKRLNKINYIKWLQGESNE